MSFYALLLLSCATPSRTINITTPLYRPIKSHLSQSTSKNRQSWLIFLDCQIWSNNFRATSGQQAELKRAINPDDFEGDGLTKRKPPQVEVGVDPRRFTLRKLLQNCRYRRCLVEVSWSWNTSGKHLKLKPVNF